MRDIFELVYLVYEDKLKTQRDFSESMYVSLGKVNKLFKEALDLGYINAGINYTITDKGLEFLNEHKVDNAIIMAAGFGSRFVPMTYETPKGLLHVFDEVMIERQIKQLLEVGISDISIVVGYLKEKFEYLTDKYNVKLIYNPDYGIKNNVSSIYYAQDILKNTYILPSDIYMPKNIFRKYEYKAFYAMEYFKDFKEEWALMLNKDNLITSINPSGDSDSWFMCGPAFFDNTFSLKFKELVNNYYHDSATSDYYWEDILRLNLKQLDIYGRKYPFESILEFESLEELREFDSSYLSFSHSKILDLIMEIFNVQLSDIKNITVLKEGMTNDSFLFEVNNKRYVFRNPGVGSSELINRENEAAVYKVINDLNISDKIIYINPDNGYKISEFIEDSRVIDIENKVEVKLAMDKLREFHNLDLKVNHTFNIKDQIEFYYELVEKANALWYKDIDEVYHNIKQVLKLISNYERPRTLAHIDAVYTNFLIKDNEIVLLDYEYAGMADPLIDVAMYSVFAYLKEEDILELLDMYLNEKANSEEIIVTYAYVALAGFLWSLWTLYKQANGEDFGTYGIIQYKYARDYSRIVLDMVKTNEK